MLELFFLLPIINTAIAVASLGLLAATTLLTYDLIRHDGKLFGQHLNCWLWPLIIATSIGGLITSLLYSEVFLFVPCSLCWLQRVALYPIALMAIMAYRLRDTIHFPHYGIGLSLFGLLVAVYQYIYQILPAETRESFAPCLVDGSADCAEKVLEMFGFVTFPFVSAVSFAFLITLFLYLKKSR